jgi:hypothetical protein
MLMMYIHYTILLMRNYVKLMMSIGLISILAKILVGKCDTQNFKLIFNFEIYIHCHYSFHVQNWIHKIWHIVYATKIHQFPSFYLNS